MEKASCLSLHFLPYTLTTYTITGIQFPVTHVMQTCDLLWRPERNYGLSLCSPCEPPMPAGGMGVISLQGTAAESPQNHHYLGQQGSFSQQAHFSGSNL